MEKQERKNWGGWPDTRKAVMAFFRGAAFWCSQKHQLWPYWADWEAFASQVKVVISGELSPENMEITLRPDAPPLDGGMWEMAMAISIEISVRKRTVSFSYGGGRTSVELVLPYNGVGGVELFFLAHKEVFVGWDQFGSQKWARNLTFIRPFRPEWEGQDPDPDFWGPWVNHGRVLALFGKGAWGAWEKK